MPVCMCSDVHVCDFATPGPRTQLIINLSSANQLGVTSGIIITQPSTNLSTQPPMQNFKTENESILTHYAPDFDVRIIISNNENHQ